MILEASIVLVERPASCRGRRIPRVRVDSTRDPAHRRHPVPELSDERSQLRLSSEHLGQSFRGPLAFAANRVADSIDRQGPVRIDAGIRRDGCIQRIEPTCKPGQCRESMHPAHDVADDRQPVPPAVFVRRRETRNRYSTRATLGVNSGFPRALRASCVNPVATARAIRPLPRRPAGGRAGARRQHGRIRDRRDARVRRARVPPALSEASIEWSCIGIYGGSIAGLALESPSGRHDAATSSAHTPMLTGPLPGMTSNTTARSHQSKLAWVCCSPACSAAVML